MYNSMEEQFSKQRQARNESGMDCYQEGGGDEGAADESALMLGKPTAWRLTRREQHVGGGVGGRAGEEEAAAD